MVELDRAAFEAPTALSEKLSGNEQSYKHSTGYYFVQLIVFFFIQYMACEHETINKLNNALDYKGE